MYVHKGPDGLPAPWPTSQPCQQAVDPWTPVQRVALLVSIAVGIRTLFGG
jgi:hypothetical protein